MNEIINNVTEVIEEEKSAVGEQAEETVDNGEKPVQNEVGICPRCGSVVREGPKAFYCSNREDCDFFIYKQDKRIGRKYTADEIRELLTAGKVTLRGCTSSKGNRYAAVFELEDTGDLVNLKFVEFVKKKKETKEE